MIILLLCFFFIMSNDNYEITLVLQVNNVVYVNACELEGYYALPLPLKGQRKGL